MAQNFYTAIWAFSICFVLTVAVSLMTTPRPDAELVGLVRSLTTIPEDDKLPWFRRPVALALIVLVILVSLNVIFY